MGVSAGDEFLNAAATLQTSLSPTALLPRLHHLEQALGRERKFRWGPRTIDLDLLFHGDTVLDLASMVIPHPCLWFRRFVLQPLREVAPDWRHPVLHETVRQLSDRLEQRPLQLELSSAGGVQPVESLVTELNAEFDAELLTLTAVATSALPTADQFARLVVVPLPSEADPRTQPRHQASRCIELPVKNPENRAEIGSAVRQIISAILG